MENMVRPTNVMGVSLLHKCNFNCEHCGYIYIGDAEDHIIKPGYKLTWEQVNTAIKESASLEGSYWNLNYTGGEPTLWEDNGHDFTDILINTANAGHLTTYNTNGSYFYDLDKTRAFLDKYLENTDALLRTFISMDKFHKNYDEEKGRSKSLDNWIKAMEYIPEDKQKLLPVHIITIVTKDPNSSLPEEMKSYYREYGINFGDFPMMNIGKAKDISDQLPDPPDFGPLPKRKDKGPGGVTLVGNDYYSGSKIIGKLGHLLDLYPGASVN
jgi:MoaA/NifB/PqqE/SkfB family radical SAM enzyme